ncbi:calcium/sodium antiporter [Asticcacaulis sp. AND118]|uniref:calcium/sodium antiporter n=1 Tax=Asticcacaulis sp. AND118 TaxID=2840468 RepID=UPI001CFFE763|nr:calcium/sodium antiporter [Asticcacaulis sp. AND118]UDF02560.1 calcium/sodium antiporter [Asticcacaulis sp. AND118]
MDVIVNFIAAYIDAAWVDYVLIAGGLGLLFVGGESLIRGAVSLALNLRMSRLIIGLTVVGMGTSAPELMVSVQSALKGSPDLAVGNVVGSNIANILLIMGIGALLSPMAASGLDLKRDALIMFAVTVGLLWLGLQGVITRDHGWIMLALLAAYLMGVYIWEKVITGKDTPPAGDAVREPPGSPFLALIWVGLGLLMLVTGADALVRGAENVARGFGISEAVIGLTLVAVGTSLPELTVTIIAAFRRQGEVSLGNLIGSNIFNILGILGVTAGIAPLSISSQMARIDIPVAVGVAGGLFLLILFAQKIGRLSGLIFLGLYAAYMAWLFTSA